MDCEPRRLFTEDTTTTAPINPSLHILKVNNIDWNRNIEQELEKSKEYLSTLHFNFLELGTKQAFLREIVTCSNLNDIQTADIEAKVKETRELKRKNKENVSRVLKENRQLASSVVTEYENYQQLFKRLQNAKIEPDSAQLQELQNIKDQIESANATLEQQEDMLRSLSSQKREVEIDYKQRRDEPKKEMKAERDSSNPCIVSCHEWYQGVNTLLQALAGRKVVDVRDRAIDICYDMGNSNVLVTLQLECDGSLLDAYTTYELVSIDDIVEEHVIRNDVQGLLCEIEARIANHKALLQELESLESRFTISFNQEAQPYFVHISKDNLWTVTLEVHYDYPQLYAPPTMVSAKSASITNAYELLENESKNVGTLSLSSWADLAASVL